MSLLSGGRNSGNEDGCTWLPHKTNSCTQSVCAASSPCFFSFSPPPSLFCVSSLQMWLREPLPWQSTQRNLLLWVILHWTSSYTSGRDQTHVPTEPRAQEHLVAIILSPPPFPPPPPLDPPTPTPSCTHRFYSAAADGAFWHFWRKGMGALVQWRSDLSPKCQAHQKERATELIAAETEE